jgi:hypothetical protein
MEGSPGRSDRNLGERPSPKVTSGVTIGAVDSSAGTAPPPAATTGRTGTVGVSAATEGVSAATAGVSDSTRAAPRDAVAVWGTATLEVPRAALTFD